MAFIHTTACFCILKRSATLPKLSNSIKMRGKYSKHFVFWWNIFLVHNFGVLSFFHVQSKKLHLLFYFCAIHIRLFVNALYIFGWKIFTWKWTNQVESATQFCFLFPSSWWGSCAFCNVIHVFDFEAMDIHIYNIQQRKKIEFLHFNFVSLSHSN